MRNIKTMINLPHHKVMRMRIKIKRKIRIKKEIRKYNKIQMKNSNLKKIPRIAV